MGHQLWSKPFASQGEKLGAGGSLLTVGHCGGAGGYGKCVSLYMYFLSRPRCQSHSAFLDFS